MIEALTGGYGWWILGFGLLGLELIVPGVYLMFFGIAAVVVGTNAFFLGPDWFALPQQLIAFAAVSAATIFLGNRWYRSGRGGGDEDADTGNPARRLVGREARLSEAISAGRGRAAIGDGWWTVEGPDCPAGTRVRVTGASGNLLIVEPLSGTDEDEEAARDPHTA